MALVFSELGGCLSLPLSAVGLICGFFRDSPWDSKDFLTSVVWRREGPLCCILSLTASAEFWEFNHSPLAIFCWGPIIFSAHPLRPKLKWPYFSILLHMAPRKPSRIFCSSRWASKSPNCYLTFALPSEFLTLDFSSVSQTKFSQSLSHFKIAIFRFLCSHVENFSLDLRLEKTYFTSVFRKISEHSI